MEFAITVPMFFVGADDSWLPRGAGSFLLAQLFLVLQGPLSEAALSGGGQRILN